MKVAVLCEFSGIVRDAFISAGHDAISCDLEPTESPGPHIRGDCRNYDWSGYDLIIGHPPCQYLANIGVRWNKRPGRIKNRSKALDFFIWMYNLPVEKIALENPIGYINTHFRKPDQIIQPYYFGDREMKTTCLWLKNLPPLIHSPVKDLFFEKTHTEKPIPKGYHKKGPKKGRAIHFTEYQNGKDKSKKRSKTFPGIGAAMADQWGGLES